MIFKNDDLKLKIPLWVNCRHVCILPELNKIINGIIYHPLR